MRVDTLRPNSESQRPIVSSRAAQPLTVSEVVRSISGPIRRVRPSVPYMIGLAVSSITMVLLPLLYLGIIALVAWGTILYARHALVMFDGIGHYRVLLLKGIAYGAPIVAGAIVVLVMLKPLLARPSREVSPYDIEPGQEPAFFALLKCIADSVGSPVPRRVELTCEPNASASFRRGLLSFFGRDLTLTLGTPLIASLEADQLAGVIAHELGHFTQGFAMRCTYLIGIVGGWFERVVESRDSWDDAIDGMIQSETWIGIGLGLTSRFAVVVSRLILRIFMTIGHALTCMTARQMEFNADLAQIRFAGSETFATTFERLELVGHSFQFTLGGVVEMRAARRLPDDVPALVRSGILIMPPGLRTFVQRARSEEKTQLFSTHPPTRIRIERATRAAAPGVIMLEAPASRLFRNYRVLCRWTTIGFYRDWLGFKVGDGELAPVEEVVESREQRHAANEAIDRALPPIVDAVQLSPLVCPRAVPADKARAMHRAAADALMTHRARALAAAENAHRASTQRDELAAASALLSLNQKIPAELVDGIDVSSEALDRRRSALEGAIAQYARVCDEYSGLLAVRVEAARLLLGDARDRIALIDDDLERVARIARNRDRLRVLQGGVREAGAFSTPLKAAREGAPVREHVIAMTLRLQGTLRELRDDLRVGPARSALAGFEERIVESVPQPERQLAPEILDSTRITLARAIDEYRGSVGRLALAAEALV